jgi:hypothetical protein
MGLDMYLHRKTYVKNWEFMGPEERHSITVFKGGKPRADVKPERIAYIIEQVAYWRKANHIHKWFVDNCQDGEDDCREACVSQEQLADLVALCKQVLGTVETVEGDIHTGTTYYPDGKVIEHIRPGEVVAQQGVAASILPTQSGFFFGGTEYDEYYLDATRYTLEQLEPLLAEEGDGDFTYRSSW